DEFNGTSLDLTNWNYTTGNGCGGSSGCGFGNNELEYYTSGTNNITVTGGNLVITAKNQTNYLGSGSNYTSGKISTSGLHSWKYGRMESRMQVPSGNAIWPAFWMLSDLNNWPNSGEIDILETQNSNPTSVNQTLHFYCTPCGNAQLQGNAYNNGTNWSSGFHIYAVDWSPSSIIFSVDGVTTASYTPSTIGSTGATTSDWPFDASNFYIIFNLAVGGSYTGNATPVPGQFPLNLLVDYVRVYSTPTSLQITGQDLVFVGSTETYTVNSGGASTTYSWTVPAGATIVSGQGTSQISVNWASGSGGNVSVSVDPDGAGPCLPSNTSYPVKTIVNSCALIMDDFESNQYLQSQYSNGVLTVVANPAPGGSNSSSTVGKYARNVGSTYDILGYKDFLVGNPDDFRAGIRQFTMDVRSNVPAGTPITIEFDNSVLMVNPYPSGRHSQYSAVTGPSNTWTKLTFTFTSSPDLTITGANVDRLQILFHPNSNVAGEVYYFDNLTAQGVVPPTSNITGSTSVCTKLNGVTYSVVPGFSNSTFNWTVPAGASIASGQGTSSITVNFGTTGGNVTVTETSDALCTTTKSLAVTVSGTCILATNFSATPLSTCAGNTIVFTNLTTGMIGGETYAWNFGSGATPATSSNAVPGNITYSTGGAKTVSLTVTNANGSNTNTKTSYITIAPPPTSCIFSDDFTQNTVAWVTPNPGAFIQSESGTVWTISNAGYSEWQNFSYALNNGTVASPLNFACAANKPIMQIKAKASANALLRIQMVDGTGQSTDNMTTYNLELTTSYQIFTINYAGNFRNYYGATPGPVDSSNIASLLFYINPGYYTYPYTGVNGTYNTAFPGTVQVDWIVIGNNCTPPSSLPVEMISFTATPSIHHSATLTWSTAQELNNSYFIVEKSYDDSTFYPIGTVAGKGNSSSITVYSIIDTSSAASFAYYRLKQVDINGNFQYSKVITLSYPQEPNEVMLYPNPSEGNNFSIVWRSENQEEQLIEILNMLGEKIYEQKMKAQDTMFEGKNIPVKLDSGVYIIQMNGLGITKRLIIN
ncbi:MAG TPA: family 16 glycosylhydrolase, partial [Cytophagaceae bacterium]|nr:family 16 glycosylhydrolase [Cytophagaceae bacterium]